MKVTTTITQRELKYIHEYAAFFRNRQSPCVFCSPSDRAGCCGCPSREEYNNDLTAFKEAWCDIDNNVVLNETVKAYMDALNEADKAAKALDEANRRMQSAKEKVARALDRLTIEE